MSTFFFCLGECTQVNAPCCIISILCKFPKFISKEVGGWDPFLLCPSKIAHPPPLQFSIFPLSASPVFVFLSSWCFGWSCICPPFVLCHDDHSFTVIFESDFDFSSRLTFAGVKIQFSFQTRSCFAPRNRWNRAKVESNTAPNCPVVKHLEWFQIGARFQDCSRSKVYILDFWF